MWRAVRGFAKAGAAGVLCVLIATLHQSSGDALAWPLVPREVRIETKRFAPQGLSVEAPLHFVAAWRLRSGDRAFGGLSALAKIDGGFLALSDSGSLVRLTLDRAAITSLPKGCGGWSERRDRDSESLAVEPGGALNIGFERRNVICRIAPDGHVDLIAPPAMRGWPATGGAETLARLKNGRSLVISERPGDDGPVSPALLLGGRNTMPLRYRPPAGFRPTDAAQLPGGALLVLNRRFEPPLSMPGRLVLIDTFERREMRGRKIAWFDGPDLDQNFEGVAVSRSRGRTFVWLISDDNFMPMQDTVLLLFEYRARAR